MRLFNRKNQRTTRQTSGRSLNTTNYYRPRQSSQNQSSEAKNIRLEQGSKDSEKRKFPLVSLVNYSILFVIILIVVFATTLSSTPDVNLSKNSYNYRDESEYTEKSSQILKDDLLLRSKLLFQSSKFEEAFLAEFPEVAQVNALIPIGGRDLTVAVMTSEPFSRLQNGSETVILDNSGIIVIEKNLSDDELINVRLATPQDNFEKGTKVLTDNEIEILRLLNSEIRSLELSNYEKLSLGETLFSVRNGQFQSKVNGAPFFVKISTYADPSQQIGAFVSTIKQLDREGGLPEEYIDVRVPGRVFVK